MTMSELPYFLTKVRNTPAAAAAAPPIRYHMASSVNRPVNDSVIWLPRAWDDW